MNHSQFPITTVQGLQFFGKITASISHEIKNCLAIMQENAGLLQDLLLLHQRGKPLDPERIDRIAALTLDQIKRADKVVRHLNQFAHSTDDVEKSINLEEALSLTVALNSRLASNGGVRLALKESSQIHPWVLNPYLLQYLLGQCLAMIIQVVETGETLTLSVQAMDNRPIIVCEVEHFDDMAALVDRMMSLEEIQLVLDHLNCRLTYPADQKQLHLCFD